MGETEVISKVKDNRIMITMEMKINAGVTKIIKVTEIIVARVAKEVSVLVLE